MMEAGFANPQALAISIGRCAESLRDVDRLRGETDALKEHPGELATFAGALFELECAKKGDPAARANMLDTADQLLQFWRDKSGDQLASTHPTLSQLWTDASQMLASFEKKKLERALAACFEARTDPEKLQRALEELKPAGDRRVEFATCLYHLELTRLSVATSRVEFARRIGLVQEAYLDPAIAAELVGGDVGLEHLWKELGPYLDEFFEAQEQAQEARLKATDPSARVVPPPPPPLSDPAVPAVPTPVPSVPAFVSEAELLTSTEAAEMVEIIETHEHPGAALPPPPPASLYDTFPPPPPPAVPPPPPRSPSQDSEVQVIELEEAPAAPPKRRVRDLDVHVDHEPTEEGQAFWRHTEAALGLLPDSNAPRTGARVLSADGRAERKKLNAWLDGMQGHFTDLPDARAMQCLMRLYMAAQIKEKTLFGQPNPKRKDAFRAALGLLSSDGAAAGRAAVWFQLDGEETVQHLQAALETVQDFLQFCARETKDPLDPAAVDAFLS